MVSSLVWDRAQEIVASKGVEVAVDSVPGALHFKVLQRSGVKCDVFLSSRSHGVFWSCNAVRGQNGCVFTKARSKPFCSHTVAAMLFLAGWKKEGFF